MSPYIFPGLSKIIRQMINPQPFVLDKAQPLYNNIMKTIEKNGGVNMTLDHILAENPKIYGWRITEINQRIRRRVSINESTATLKRRWSADELNILLSNRYLNATQLTRKLKRSVNSIRYMRNLLRK